MANHLRLVLDLEPDTSPISGELSSDLDAPRPFHGWLQLASAIETLRTGASPARDHDRAKPSGSPLARP